MLKHRFAEQGGKHENLLKILSKHKLLKQISELEPLAVMEKIQCVLERNCCFL